MMGDFRNKIDLDGIFDKLDAALEFQNNIMIVCNYELADEIVEYLDDEYDISPENTALYEDGVDEYYVSLNFYADEFTFYCENARARSGNFKINDCDSIEYYVFLEMTDDEVERCLQAEEGTIGFYDLVDDEDEEDSEYDDDEDEEDEGYEPDDSDSAELEMLLNWAERIEDGDLCFGCIFNTIADAFYAGKDIGARNSKLEMIEQLSEDIEEMDE